MTTTMTTTRCEISMVTCARSWGWCICSPLYNIYTTPSEKQVAIEDLLLMVVRVVDTVAPSLGAP